MLNLYSGVLLVQVRLHALINNRIRRSPDDHGAFLLCGVVKLRDRVVPALGLVLSVGSATEQQRQRAYNANQTSRSPHDATNDHYAHSLLFGSVMLRETEAS